MWRFEPAEISIRPGSTADIYLSTADVTHGMQSRSRERFAAFKVPKGSRMISASRIQKALDNKGIV
jgi:hypothetical protein